jgi:hypothetical protein
LLARWITQEEKPKGSGRPASLVSKIIEKNAEFLLMQYNFNRYRISKWKKYFKNGNNFSNSMGTVQIQIFKYLLIDKPTFESSSKEVW